MKFKLPASLKPTVNCLLVGLASSFFIHHSSFSQQFLPTTNTTVTIPPVVWQGTNAQLLARQLLSLTNASGGLILPPGLFTNRTSAIYIRVEVGTNGAVKTVRARIR